MRKQTAAEAAGTRRRALIKIGYRCNNNCLFCHCLPKRKIAQLDTSEVVRKIRAAAGDGFGMVIFSGGEPAIRPDIFRLAEAARGGGLGFGLVTNGRMFAYRGFAERMAACGLGYALVSLHSADAAVHDALCGAAGCFEETVDGLSNLSGRVEELVVSCVVTQLNVRGLRGLVDLALRFRPSKLRFSLMEPKGAGLKRFRGLAPGVHEAACAAADAVQYGEGRAGGAAFGCDGFPRCLVFEPDRRTDDLRSHGIEAMSEADEDEFHPVDHGERAFAGECAECLDRKVCPGIYKKYLDAGLHRPLVPLRLRAPNSFVFVEARRMGAGRFVPCEVLKAGVFQAVRSIAVKEGRAVRVFTTRTGDFSEAGISKAARVERSLFENLSPHPTGRVRKKDLALLRALPECEKCLDAGSACPGVFKRSGAEPFAESERFIERRLTRLRGEVLDIGAGGMPYFPAVAGLLRSGKISRYVVADPLGPPAAARRAVSSGILLWHRVDAELFDPCGSMFDAIVLLRSLNHLRDLDAAVGRLVRSLKPGGLLLAADNPIFGIVVKGSRSWTGKGKFHHFRSLGLDEATNLFRSLGLRLVGSSRNPGEWAGVFKR